MSTDSRPYRNEQVLLLDAATHAKEERDARDLLIVDIAEIDARRVYRQAGYPSTVAYCMGELQLSRKAALHRIHVARTAWRHPAILAALTERRLHLTAVSMLASHLIEENVDELVAVAAGKTKEELRLLIEERFPPRDLFATPPTLDSQPLLPAIEEPAPPIQIHADDVDRPALPVSEPVVERRLDGVRTWPAPRVSEPEVERRLDGVPTSPISLQVAPPRFPLRIALEGKTHGKLQYARDLLGHQIPSGDLADVLDRVLDVFIARAEKRKFGVTDKPKTNQCGAPSQGRHIPAAVRRLVLERDGRQCTFVSESGTRCPARGMLEFDHVLEVARGGQSTVANLRLRCRAHNQYTAERTFGVGFMEAKRGERHAFSPPAGVR